jgi:histidinol-phosphate phosphatase family protein
VNNHWAVFLDRDGTINRAVGLLTRPDELQLIKGAGSALASLQRAGALLIVVTNQPAIARELISEDELAEIHKLLISQLAAEGVKLDAIYYCPHHPETHHPEACNPLYRRDCECRKPKPGMIIDAAKEFGVDIASSYLVGDSTRDVAAARAAGCTSVLVRTGCAGNDGACPDVVPDSTVADLSAAAEWILQHRVTA